MAKRKKIKFEVFLDGICEVWQLDEAQVPRKLLGGVRFQRRVVGTKRNYEAEQAGHNIEMLIRIPRVDNVTRGAFVVIAGRQFKVLQTQIIPDTIPQCTDITLEQPDLLIDFDSTEVGAGGRI